MAVPGKKIAAHFVFFRRCHSDKGNIIGQKADSNVADNTLFSE